MEIIIKINFLLAITYMLYKFWLKQQLNLKQRRFYILISTLLSVITPLIWFAFYSKTVMQNVIIQLPVIEFSTIQSPSSTLNVINWVPKIYVGVLIAMAMVFISGIVKIINHIRIAKKQKMYNQTVWLSPIPGIHFNFFGFIVISQNTNQQALITILNHEQTHKKQWHSLDILLMEIIKVVNWFNPLVWLLKREVVENNEFLADQGASVQNISEYQNWLFSGLFTELSPIPVNQFFNRSLIKSRIVMLQSKSTIKSASGLKLMAIMSAAILFSVAISCTKTVTNEGLVKPENDFSTLTKMPEFKGGEQALFSFLGNQIKYPEASKKTETEGTVHVSFVISETGKVKDVEVIRSVDPLLDQEAVRVISEMPNWQPAEKDGKKVAVAYKIPIKFALK